MWHRITDKCGGDIPPGICSHSATLVRDEELVMIGGGFFNASTNEFQHISDVYVLNLRTLHWRRFCDDNFTPRRGHGASLWKNETIVVFGGIGNKEDGNSRLLNSLDLLNTTTFEWKCNVKCSGEVPGRRGHMQVLVDEKLFVFGGECPDSMLRVLDLATFTWSMLKVSNVQNTEVPYCIRFSVVELLDESTVLCLGGTNIWFDAGLMGDSIMPYFKFDLKTATWEPPNLQPSSPCNRIFSAGARMGDSVYLFGGCLIQENADGGDDNNVNDLIRFDLEFNVFQVMDKFEDETNLPPRMNGMSCSVFADGTRMLVFGGGRYPDFYSNDVFIFDGDGKSYMPSFREPETYEVESKPCDESDLVKVEFPNAEKTILQVPKRTLVESFGYFRGFLMGNFLESNEQRGDAPIRLPPMDDSVLSVEVFQMILDFVHSGTIPKANFAEIIFTIQILAFDDPILQEICQQKLIASLQKDNAIDLLVFAHQSSCPILRKACLTYFQWNFGKIQQASAAFNETEISTWINKTLDELDSLNLIPTIEHHLGWKLVA